MPIPINDLPAWVIRQESLRNKNVAICVTVCRSSIRTNENTRKKDSYLIVNIYRRRVCRAQEIVNIHRRSVSRTQRDDKIHRQRGEDDIKERSRAGLINGRKAIAPLRRGECSGACQEKDL